MGANADSPELNSLVPLELKGESVPHLQQAPANHNISIVIIAISSFSTQAVPVPWAGASLTVHKPGI